MTDAKIAALPEEEQAGRSIRNMSAPPEERWIRVKAKTAVKIRIPLMFRIPFGRGKVRVDLRLQELGAGMPPDSPTRVPSTRQLKR